MNNLSFTMRTIWNKTLALIFFFFLSTQFICTFQWGSQRPWFAITLDKCEPVSTDRWFGHSTFQRPLNTIHVWVWNKSNCSNKLSHGHQSEKLTFIFPFLLRVQCKSWEIANLWLISVTCFFFFSLFFLWRLCVLFLWAWRSGPQSFTMLLLSTV